jgi:catechol 2,3-dioxygenase-like lactoylglutathione lyase family enzyme
LPGTARVRTVDGMLTRMRLMAFVATTDPARARGFYEGTLGLRLAADEPSALVFDAGGTMLRVQKVRELAPHPFTALGWEVRDVTAEVRALSACGVAFLRVAAIEQDEDAIWSAPGGARVAWFKDPDGNTLSLTELPRELAR